MATHTILLPHGLGFNKLLTDGHDGTLRLAGLPPEQALRAGQVTVTLSHPDQRAQLAAVSAHAEQCTMIVGDPTYDRLRASLGLRARYREALGAGDRRLVTLASTWGSESLIGRRSRLPHQLLADLPIDSYQVVVVLHPNVWARYGRFQIELWFASALDAGMVLMPPESGWQSALIAADVVVSDQGSLGLFTAALDRPLLMVGRAAETVSGTPVETLAASAPTLYPDRDLRHQLDAATNSYQPGRYQHITDRVFADVGTAARNVQALIYRELDVPLPAYTTPAPRIPVPDCGSRPVRSFVVRTGRVADAMLDLVRIPAAAWQHQHHAGGLPETHLVAGETESDPKIIERAAAITHDRELDAATGTQWARSALTDYPGARFVVAATPRGAVAAMRGGVTVMATTSSPHPQRAALIASALYCCLLDGCLSDQRITVRAGVNAMDVSFTVAPASDATSR
ncbi:hypothetical protein [Nocardia sp. NPDC058666]|uniref:hypothetical protein n=1 Tax=Nocardia sp. NPDC058666 TaxID=3346587 RepID=UPI0036653FC0